MDKKSRDIVLGEILKSNHGRKGSLVRKKLGEMAAGVFTFFRGSNDLFAREWPTIRPIDAGPNGLICGDLHLENFGAYLTEAGDCRFAINDFDEAYVAPCGVDLVRCSASIFLASEEWKLPTSTAAAMVVEFLDHYRKEIAATVITGQIGSVDSLNSRGAVLELITPTAIGSRKELLVATTQYSKRLRHPTIRLDAKKRPITSKKRDEIESAFRELSVRSEMHRSIEVLDATTRLAGLGSLGLRRYLLLVKGGTAEDHLRLLDMKEASPSALRHCIDLPQPAWGEGEAARVIAAERIVLEKPESGLAAIAMSGRTYRVRGMTPDANRSKLSRLRGDVAKLREVVRVAGSIAAWAHYRGCEAIEKGRASALNTWANGASFDALMVAAAKAADCSHADFEAYQKSLRRRSVRKRLGLSPGVFLAANRSAED
jgi:uncharacterized protein (DUF2252 family)